MSEEQSSMSSRSEAIRDVRRADVTIVGAGMAGLEVAAHLVDQGISVLLLESGAHGENRHDGVSLGSDEALRRWLVPESDPHFTRPWVSLTPPHYTGPSGLRRRVGGRSLYWYGVCLGIDSWALETWPATIVDELTRTWRNGPALYDLTRSMLMEWGAFSHDCDESIVVIGRQFRPTPRAVQRSRAAHDRWRAYSPLDRWRDPDLGGPCMLPEGLSIRPTTHVHAIRPDPSGVGYQLDLAAIDGDIAESMSVGTLVLAAGTLENTRLVRSAIADSSQKQTPPHTYGLNDHIVQGFFVRIPEEDYAHVRGRLPEGSRYSSGDKDSRTNLFLEITLGPDGNVLIDVRATGEQRPDERSYLTTTTDGALGVAVELTNEDSSLIADQRATLSRIWVEIAELLSLRADSLEFGEFNSPKRVNAFVLPESIENAPTGTALTWSSYIGVEDHEAGTLPLGSLLTESHEVQGLPNVFVAGPASFPRMGAANPTLTSLALARRLATILADRLEDAT